MIYLIITLVGLIVFISSVILIKREQMEQQKYFETANQMAKETYLMSSLQNHGLVNSWFGPMQMIYLKLYNAKGKDKYVFYLERGVTIGRDSENNSIWIPNPRVSLSHCRIILYNGQAYLQDLNSTNGTRLKRRLKTYELVNGESIALKSNDKIIIEDTRMKIVLFTYQPM